MPLPNHVFSDSDNKQQASDLFPNTSNTLLPTLANPYTDATYVYKKNQQIMIIEHELASSFIQSPESTSILTLMRSSKTKSLATTFLNYFCKQFTFTQLIVGATKKFNN
jgi:hypothetical protein